MSWRHLELQTRWGPLRLIGGSRAGEATAVILPQFRLALDIGRSHQKLPAMSTVFISHGHTDHLAALASWASRRALNRMGAARILAPQKITEDLHAVLCCHARMEGETAYDIEIKGLTENSSHDLRPGFHLEFFSSPHRIPTLGCKLIWSRHQLRPELRGAKEEEIRCLKKMGHDITTVIDTPILCYAADSGVSLFDRPEKLSAEILLLECSFWRDGDQERARRFAHLHLDDILQHLPIIKAKHLVILHPSRRYRLREVLELLDEKIRPKTSAEVHHLMVDWE